MKLKGDKYRSGWGAQLAMCSTFSCRACMKWWHYWITPQPFVVLYIQVWLLIPKRSDISWCKWMTSDSWHAGNENFLHRYLCSIILLLWETSPSSAARNRTSRTTAQLAKHHLKGAEIPHRQCSICPQALQRLTSPRAHGVCVTERQAGNLGNTVHLLYSRIVHLLYTGI